MVRSSVRPPAVVIRQVSVSVVSSTPPVTNTVAVVVVFVGLEVVMPELTTHVTELIVSEMAAVASMDSPQVLAGYRAMRMGLIELMPVLRG